MDSKTCNGCHKHLELSAFRVRKGGFLGTRTHCRTCEQAVRLENRKIARPFTIKENPPIDLAWAAGIIEGEGCICIARSKSNGFGLQLTVTNTDLYMLMKLKFMFDASVKPHTVKATSRKAQYSWYVNGKRAAAVLSTIIPYMHTTKKLQAELAIQYADRFSNYPGLRKRNQDRIDEQTWYYERMRSLKHELPTMETIEV